jgi:hypothetical protein
MVFTISLFAIHHDESEIWSSFSRSPGGHFMPRAPLRMDVAHLICAVLPVNVTGVSPSGSTGLLTAERLLSKMRESKGINIRRYLLLFR